MTETDNRPTVLDLFCNAGGAAMGYHRAGFRVVGVDINPQPNYPFEFHRADVFRLTPETLRRFTFRHASPPCQHGAAITKGTNRHLQDKYPDLYQPTVDLLESVGLPYTVENTYARPDVVLCGEMFGLGTLRHRKIQNGGWSTMRPTEPRHRGYTRGYRHGVYRDGPYVAVYGKGGGKATVAEAQAAMGIDWTDRWSELVEMLPPAYTEWIGRRFLEWKALQS